MNKAYSGKLSEMVEILKNLSDQIRRLYDEEKPEFHADMKDLKTTIKIKNVCDLSNAANELGKVINLIENVRCRQFTDEG